MLEDWTIDTRRNAIRVLKYCVYIAGNQCTSYLDSIIPHLNNAVAEDDSGTCSILKRKKKKML